MEGGGTENQSEGDCASSHFSPGLHSPKPPLQLKGAHHIHTELFLAHCRSFLPSILTELMNIPGTSDTLS